jgi:hypothetical protein
MRAVTTRGWIAFGLASAAAVYAALFFASAFFVPAYSGESCIVRLDHGSECTSTSATLVGVNGARVLVWVALPALAALAGWLLLHRQCATGSRTAGQLAWVVVVALLLFSFVTGFSIGLFVLPIALLLGVSALLVDLS